MAQRLHRNLLRAGVVADAVGGNSVQFSKVDPVSIANTGLLALSGAGGERIHGFCNDDRTMAADNQTVAKTKPALFHLPGMQVVITSTTTPVAASVGSVVDIGTSATGAFTVVLDNTAESLAGTTVKQLHVVDFDPTGQSVAEVVVEVAQPQQIVTAGV